MKSKIRALLVLTIIIPMTSCNDWSVKTEEPLIDQRDGMEYQCKQIGDQIWMVENLAYQTINKSPYYASDSAKYSTFGRLYFPSEIAEAVNIPGWHLPDTSEWLQLLEYYHLNEGNCGAGVNHTKCGEWEEKHYEDIETFLSNSPNGFNFQLGGMWFLEWLNPSAKRQRSFKYMGSNGNYWASPIDTNHLYTHISFGRLKYYWMEISSKKPSSTNKSGDKFRFYLRLVKD